MTVDGLNTMHAVYELNSWDYMNRLSPESSDEQIKETAFELIGKIRWMSLSTLAVSEDRPMCRIVTVTQMDDGNIYFGLGNAKPVHDEVKKNNRVVMTATTDNLAVRVNAELERVDSAERIAAFWSVNPGIKSLYHNSLETLIIYRLKRGDGELLHLLTMKNDHIDKTVRYRFAFGEGYTTFKPNRITIIDNCIACGNCANMCFTGAIKKKDGHFYVDRYNCLECGACIKVCPVGAITKLW